MLRKRHSGVVRIAHWLNTLLVVLLIGTGFNIFNAHPTLYWGSSGSAVDRGSEWLRIGAVRGAAGIPSGVVLVGGTRIDTDGFLGRSTGTAGRPQSIAYPGWLTIPTLRDLATARNWHFFSAWLLILNGLVYLVWGLASGHIGRRLLPSLRELRPANIGHDIMDHLKLNFPKGEAALRYQVLQKIAYSGVALLLLPLMVLTGLAMSPGMDAAAGWLAALFGGRQSARSIHWIATNLVILFIAVHLAMLVLAGPFKLLRGMITGWQKVEPEAAE